MKKLFGLMVLTTVLRAGGPVSYRRLLKADHEPGNWLMYSGDYSGHRYSRLDQITTANVSRLRPKWIFQMQTTHRVETSPLVVDGIMYLTRPPNGVIALDTETGRTLWEYEYRVPEKVYTCCGLVNRGLAILGDRLFMCTMDAKVVALDAKSGRLLWKATMANYEEGYAATLAPLVVKDKVIVGVAGGEFGIRGFIDAYNAASGERAWRFYTIPAPGDPHFGTWEDDSWKTGGAPVWVTGSYDPELNLTYWGTGNPGPDWNGDKRGGDNLFSDSMLALDVDSGKLKWYFQFTPHDTHGWDCVHVPVLLDSIFRGQKRKLLLNPNRNGFYYVLDRQTGEYLMAKQYVKQTWARGIDDRGRPMVLPDTDPTMKGRLAYPGADGGMNWLSPSYSPATGLLYVVAREKGDIYFKTETVYKAGLNFEGGGQKFNPDDPGYGLIKAFVPQTGEIRWEHKLLSAPWSGVLSTAGGLVFGGTLEGNVFALDAKTGRDLWHFPGNGVIRANLISYLSNGKQQVAIPVGDVVIVFALE